MGVSRHGYMAVRLTEDKEWLDKETLAYSESDARKFATDSEKNIPEWAKENPVVRVAKIRIEEVLD